MKSAVQKISDYTVLGYTQSDQEELEQRNRSLKVTSKKPTPLEIAIHQAENNIQGIQPSISKEYKRHILLRNNV